MANLRPLVLTGGGILQRHQDADVLIVGSGLSVSSGNLSLSAATAILLGTNTTVSAGVLLSTAGSGNINLPNNGSARFQVEGVAVSANVTAANLGLLTGGSNADALHVHSASAEIGLGSLTTTGMSGGTGTFAYLSAANTVLPTDSAAIGTARVVGCYNGVANSVTVHGVIAAAKFTTVGGSPVVGSPVYLAAASDDTNTGAGKLTATCPSSGVVSEVGICVDASNYAGAKTARVVLQIKSPVVL